MTRARPAVFISRWLLPPAAVALAWAFGPSGVSSAFAPAETVTLSIVGTNDLHGAVAGRRDTGGLSTFAGYVANLRAARERDGAVLLLDAGDMFQGTLESNLNEGAAIVAAYNALGYTAAAIGNHEFDFGPVGERATPATAADDPRGALKARAREAHFPVLAANLVDRSTGQAVAWPNVQPSALVDVAGIRVGLVGVTTSGTLHATIAGNTVGLQIAPLEPTILSEATRLRARGAGVVVVLAHAGGRCTRFDAPADLSSCQTPSEIGDVATRLPHGLVDAIVAGHTHAGMAHEIAGIPIIESFSSGRAFGRIDLTVTREHPRVIGHRIFAPRTICAFDNGRGRCLEPGRPGAVRATYEGREVRPSLQVDTALAPAIDAARRVKARPIGIELTTSIRRSYDKESALGNLFATAMLESVPGADVALTNGGGLRADLPAGALTWGSLYEAMPFDNHVARLRLTGGSLARVLAGNLTAPHGLLSVAGILVDARCDDGALRVRLSRSSGVPVRDDEELLVVTSDFLATGGDAAFAPVRLLQVIDAGADAPLLRDVIAARLRARGGKIGWRDVFDPAHPRWTYPGPRPVRCGTH
jgi:5'-nucleotidase